MAGFQTSNLLKVVRDWPKVPYLKRIELFLQIQVQQNFEVLFLLRFFELL